jgi:hypothetical protein
LINPQLAAIVPINGYGLVKINHPIIVHRTELVENFRSPAHVQFETTMTSCDIF